MEETLKAFRILASSELTLASLNGRRWARQALAYAIAILLGLLAVSLLNYAIFGLIEEGLGAPAAAGVMAIADLILAGGFAAWAGRQQPGPEEALVREIRGLVIEQIEADASQVGKDLATIRSTFAGATSGLASVATLMPLIRTAIEGLKSHGD